MINEQPYNAPAVAPETDDLAALLPAFRTFMGESLLGIDDLYPFFTTPSAQRTRFLNSLTSTAALRDGKYITQKYS
jgi:hypothetical protein